MTTWTPADSEETYNVPNWGGGFFHIDETGHVRVRANGEGPGIDIFELIGQIRRRGISPPVLLRFDGILRGRVKALVEAFDHARAEFGYPAPYHPIFPFKVNQQRHVVEALLEEGQPLGMGLEVGSKPELLAVMAQYSGPDRLIICNGYKDREYIATALLSSQLGSKVIIVIEKYTELAFVFDAAKELGIRPRLGVRTKLGGAGAGRWMDSGGDRSKFGLTTRQIVRLVAELERHDMLDCLQLLHFHLGSQITRIRSIKRALREATRTFVGLRELGAPVRWFDVGGGLGVDYDGSSTDFESSMNYDLQEYANDVVYQTKEACDAADVPVPTILSESGRALSAHHAVLVAEVVGVSDYSTVGIPAQADEDEHEIILKFAEVCEAVSGENYLESYHDAQELRDECMILFGVGQLSLAERARVEEFYWRTCEKVLRIIRTQEYVPEDLEHLERDMADTYFMNFSVFQSLPDSWAIDQLFPVMPIHRLDEMPSRRAVIADITCDSDGKVDRFVSLRDVKKTLELHPWTPDSPYYLGFFLVGAYQEILGDMHNLFGDTNVVHVDETPDGRPRLRHVINGDRVEEVLSYVEYFRGELTERLRRTIEQAIEEDRMSLEQAAALQRRFENELSSYTYLITREPANGEAPR
ncbi:MAG: biosynthetic arginine decarboxylase [Planctomycetota bacterium]